MIMMGVTNRIGHKQKFKIHYFNEVYSLSAIEAIEHCFFNKHTEIPLDSFYYTVALRGLA